MAELKVVKAHNDMKIGEFGYDVSKEELTVDRFMDRLKVFKFNDPLQRNVVWNLKKKSLLILSILQGIDIGEFKVQIIRRSEMRIRNVLDGKQRLTTIRDYIKGKFRLEPVGYVLGYDEYGNMVNIDVSGLLFEELPPTFQSRIKGLLLIIHAYEVGDSIKAELFYRWNNGEALTPAEKRIALMDPKLRETIALLKELEIFNFGFPKQSLNRGANSDAIQQGMILLQSDGKAAIGSKAIDDVIADGGFDQAIQEQMISVSQFLNEAFRLVPESEQKQAFNKTKTVSLIYAASKAIEANITVDAFAEWIVKFFVDDYAASGFSEYASSGTASADSVKRRISILMSHFTSHFGLTD
jgi:hypothetical protein